MSFPAIPDATRVLDGQSAFNFVVEANTHLLLIEHYRSQPESVGELVLKPNATCKHIKIQQLEPGMKHAAKTRVTQDRDSQYTHQLIQIGAGESSNDVDVELAGKGARCDLDGLMLGANADKLSVTTTIFHQAAHTTSREYYKGVYTDSASGTFCGKVVVEQAALKTDAAQMNRNLLLSDSAVANTRPQLEIYADDVKCTHGATVGQLDDNALFYLQSRGISKQGARAMLTAAFCREIIDRIELEPLKVYLDAQLADWLAL